MRNASHQPELFFGRFCLRPVERLLLDEGEPLALGSRAFDLLLTLVDRSGQVVGRDELLKSVWPTTVVEETSLRFHISALRKVLGDGRNGARYITNVAGRGYSFVAPIRHSTEPLQTVKPDPVKGSKCTARETRYVFAPRPLPSRLTPVVGRDDSVATISSLLSQRRLVTIVGSGGVGKTTVALEVAKRLVESYADGVHLVDLSDFSDQADVHRALADAIGVEANAGSCAGTSIHDLWSGICMTLHSRRLLLVIDNCEHLIDAVARLTESVLRVAPGVSILATSREALDAESEWVHRLPPLSISGTDAPASPAAALMFSGIQLFVSRADAHSNEIVLTQDTLREVVELCRLLDGNPLALELAAIRVSSLGVKGLVARADDFAELLSRGRRTAHRRHSSLMESLEWSYGLLAETEQIVFRRLSVLRGDFDLRCAFEIVRFGFEENLDSPPLDESSVVDALMKLVTKSLIVRDASVASASYRLQNTTRGFARHKLVECGESRTAQYAHALYAMRRMERVSAASAKDPTQAELKRLQPDVSAAIEWASSADGNTALAIDLSDALECLNARRPVERRPIPQPTKVAPEEADYLRPWPATVGAG
ncbi:ATP-binding protein [Variovorax sp. HJSM1_2]